MRKLHMIPICLAGVVLGAGLVWAQGAKNFGSFRGEYALWGGTLGEPQEPSAKDTKVRLQITGALASRMYREMGPGAQQTVCVPEDEEHRSRGELQCDRQKATAEAMCVLAVDLHRGQLVTPINC